MDSGKLRVRICMWCGEQILSEHQIRNWLFRFRDGYDSLEDEDHERRPVSVNNGVLKEAVELDPRQTTRELAAQLRFSRTTVRANLGAIGKESRCGRWVPHFLSESNKTARVTVAGSRLLVRYRSLS
ncbi:unnamed protein product [Nippostrongylus brasiliensis]|uniref:HTH_48 domain-containing protein n=1 Tax=Nippostrongylus brasiliensis TaxID=27835 RepID=A0A0N4YI95_NIPBR|nr:unnamed protein product [Nippostrongylus brasiliensis]